MFVEEGVVVQERTRTIITEPDNGGKICPDQWQVVRSLDLMINCNKSLFNDSFGLLLR